MFDYLIDHALKNVWCTPDQDMQAIVKPAKLTPVGGVWNKVDVLWKSIKLPLPSVRFHVYQIGQLNPLLMGLFEASGKWVTLTEACNKEKLIADLYSASGVQMPRFETWYMVTEDKNLILAVKEQSSININLNTDPLYLRVYTNAYFNSKRSDPLDDVIYTEGRIPLSQQDVLEIQTKYLSYKTKRGTVYAFVNGYYVSTLDLFTVKPGDTVEFIYDSSVTRIVSFKIKSLPTFNSLMDLKRKYLLHYTTSVNPTSIDYHDDIDFFLVKQDPQGRQRGVYYHRIAPDSVRQLTHRDYSIPVPYIVGYAQAQPDWPDPAELILRMQVRKSGYLRPLVDEDNRLKELYKLPANLIVPAMLGTNSVVTNWRAEELERSSYTQIMRSKAAQINRELVQKTYGYNAISKLIAHTPEFVRLSSNQFVVDVPYGLQQHSIGYEYDENGRLINWDDHPSGAIYPTTNIAATMVELIAGVSGDSLDEVYGNAQVTIDPAADYRMYRCPIVLGKPTDVWEDVTNTGNYAIMGDQLTWLMDLTKFYPLVRGNKKVLSYDLDLQPLDGLLRFHLTHRARRDNVMNMYIMQIPMGELDLFLNGYSLIEGLDYFVKFPEIFIVNKEYLINPTTQAQRVTVRFSGFCKPDFTREVPAERGFVDHALLSSNNRFDIRDDKVMRIVVDGKLYDRSELLFSESNSGVSVPDARNGAPYLIRDIVVPMRGLTNDNTYSLRAKSLVIDKKISDYMTIKMPNQVFDTPNTIPNRYQVFSPFCCKIMNDLRNQLLDDPRLYHFYNDEVVMELCKPYEYLLAVDPTQEAQKQDDRYVVIHPHNLMTVVSLNIYHYKFLSRVVKLYLHDKVSLSHFIQLAS